MSGWVIRPMVPDDILATMEMRGRTRENAVSREELDKVYGVTRDGVRADMEDNLFGWVVDSAGEIGGFAMGTSARAKSSYLHSYRNSRAGVSGASCCNA